MTLSLSLFFFALLCPATSINFSFFTEALQRPVPHFVKALLNDESTAVLEMLTPPKCTISPFPLTQVEAIQYSVRVTVFNATFNNISGISWRSVLLVEETGEYHRSAASH